MNEKVNFVMHFCGRARIYVSLTHFYLDIHRKFIHSLKFPLFFYKTIANFSIAIYLHNYFNIHVRTSLQRHLTAGLVTLPIPVILSQNVTKKVAWYVVKVKTMHS